MDIITRSLVNSLFHAISEGLKRIEDPDFHEQVLAMFATSRGETRTPAGAGSA